MHYDHVPPQLPSVRPPRITFLGEAPGIDETERGQPLVGASGNVFNAMLRTANLDRAEFHITNVFDEIIPEKNDLKLSGWTAYADEAKKGGFDDLPPIGAAGYLRPEYRHHLNRLQRELEAINPTLIVPLGGTALWALTGDAGIQSQRGAIQPATYLVPGKKLLPTLHPAFVLRTWKLFSVVTGDIIRAYRESSFPDIRLPKRTLLIEPTVEEFRSFVPRLVNSDLLSVDIETGWGLLTNIGFAPDKETAINIPLVDLRQPNKSYYSFEDEIEVWKLLQYVLEHPVPKLGQNFAAYDFYWLLKGHGLKVRNLRHDTRLLHHNLYPELPKDLEFMGASYTEQGAWKTWGRKADKREN